MTLWFIVGFIVWALCILLMLAVFHGAHRNRGNEYELKLYSRYMVKLQKYVEDSVKKEVQKTARTKMNQCRPVSAH